MTTKLWIDSGDQFGLVRNATHYVWDLMKKTRFFFYLANPYETMFPDLNVPRYAAEMFPVFVLLVTIENIIRFFSGKKLSRINDSVASIGGAIFQDCFRVHIRSVEVICYCLVYNHFRLTTLPWNSLSTWFYCFLLVDLGFYWAHRLAHEVNFIWAIHQAHHSGEDFTLFAGIRQAFFQPLTAWYTYVWMGLIGIPPQIFLAHLQLTELYMLYIHTETIKSLGFLEYVFNCPSHHRVHHARNRKYIDKNYGGLFIFWDRLFGTFEQEDPKDPPIYGLVKPVESYNIFYLQFHSLVTMFRRIKATDGLRNKLAVVFKGPGWSPGKPRLGYYDDIPLIDEPVSYWDPEISAWKKIYVVWHTAMILAFYHFLTLHCNRFSQMMIFIGVISLLFSMNTMGLILENKINAFRYEIVRCILFTFVEPILFLLSGLNEKIIWNEPVIMIVRGTFFCSFCLSLTMEIVLFVRWSIPRIKLYLKSHND